MDRARQVAVTLSEVACVLGTLVGLGVLGKRVEESSGGRLSADATLIAPAGPAFSIWSVIYVGLLAYTVWQWLPGRASDPRARATGWWAAASMLLNAAWLLVTQQGWLWASVGVIVALALVLKVLVARLTARPERSGLAERLVLDGTFGLYLGWVAVATCANVAATLVDGGMAATGGTAEVTTLVVLAAVLGVATLYARRLGARLAVAAAIAWGVGWVAVGRLGDEPRSTVVGIAAIVVAVLVPVVTVVIGRSPGGRRSADGTRAALAA